jgi:hypothetical protein
MLKTSTNSPDRRRADEIQLRNSMTKTLTNYALERYIVSTIVYVSFAAFFIYPMSKLGIYLLLKLRSMQKSTYFQPKGTNQYINNLT